MAAPRLIEWRGKTQSLRAWARELGINESALRYRLNDAGWPVAKAFSQKPHPRFSRLPPTPRPR